jgi:hypothetical protein
MTNKIKTLEELFKSVKKLCQDATYKFETPFGKTISIKSLKIRIVNTAILGSSKIGYNIIKGLENEDSYNIANDIDDLDELLARIEVMMARKNEK